MGGRIHQNARRQRPQAPRNQGPQGPMGAKASRAPLGPGSVGPPQDSMDPAPVGFSELRKIEVYFSWENCDLQRTPGAGQTRRPVCRASQLAGQPGGLPAWRASQPACPPAGQPGRRATRGHRQNAKIGCPSDLRNTCFFVRPARTSDFEWFLIENMCYFSNVLAGRSFF